MLFLLTFVLACCPIHRSSAFAPSPIIIRSPTLSSHEPRNDKRRVVAAASTSSSYSNDNITIAAASKEDISFQNSNNNNNDNFRQVASIEKFARLPVWPVWVGVLIFLVNRVFGDDVAAKIEDAVGGRVCPNFFPDTTATSPFIMLVHHRHSFWNIDPIRWIQQKFILPEGFPAHPHRGFTTLTYFLKGGFVHRDSLGIQQHYGVSDSTNDGKKHSQWLFTGAGLLHEEMFDDSPDQELFQLWVNVPSHQKLQPPQVDLLGNDECPVITSKDSETIVLAGSYNSNDSKTPIMSEMCIFHVKLSKGGKWSYELPSGFETLIIYMRQGSIQVAGNNETVNVHHTAYFERGGGNLLQVEEVNGDTADFILLAGQPLGEPVAAQGSMVMNFPQEINQAYLDYQYGNMGQPWSHELANDEWKRHLTKFPCKYQYNDE